MSINMNARCDTPGCHSIQILYMEDPSDSGTSILEALRTGGWGVEGTFTPKPKSVKLTCPFCMKKRAPL